MRIGIYGGSFNPVHNGHIALAKFILAQGVVDEIWMLPSPRNPLKSESELVADIHRQQMLEVALEGVRGVEMCLIEDKLPRPSYTIRTLEALSVTYPEHMFYLIIGADNWAVFTQWREWERILEQYRILVYPRSSYDVATTTLSHPHVKLLDAPLYECSSTEVRNTIKRGGNYRDMVPKKVADYIEKKALYHYNKRLNDYK